MQLPGWQLWRPEKPLFSWLILLHLFIRPVNSEHDLLERLCLGRSCCRFFSMLSFVAALYLSNLLFLHLC